MKKYSLWVFTAIALLVLFAAYTMLRSYRETNELWQTSDPARDPVSSWDRRVRKILPDLPAGVTVGYLADWDIPKFKFSAGDQHGEWVLTRYALAPHFVKGGTAYQYIVGNFSQPHDDQWFMDTFGVTVIKRYDAELYLLQGPGK